MGQIHFPTVIFFGTLTDVSHTPVADNEVVVNEVAGVTVW